MLVKYDPSAGCSERLDQNLRVRRHVLDEPLRGLDASVRLAVYVHVGERVQPRGDDRRPHNHGAQRPGSAPGQPVTAEHTRAHGERGHQRDGVADHRRYRAAGDCE